MDQELDLHRDNGTWKEVKESIYYNIIDCR